MTGLDPVIHVAPYLKCLKHMEHRRRVDDRVEPGHDGGWIRAIRSFRVGASGRYHNLDLPAAVATSFNPSELSKTMVSAPFASACDASTTIPPAR